MLSVLPTHLKDNLQRSTSSASTGSTFALKDIRKAQVHPRPSDELGLQLVLDVPFHDGDIIFVHGLGGSAWKTWSWQRDTTNFWPRWLTEEEELSGFRIFTFGYDSDWRGAGASLNISDFAKDLLLQMLTFGSDVRTSIGTKNILFVVHSMGGLVAKKAYLLGKSDAQFSALAAKFYGIIFLGTPHRGAQSAAMLNNILSALPLAPPPKAYLADLQVTSHALHEINEQFRHHCEEIAMVSYYETEKTSLGLKDVLIVGKESAVLQSPGELSSPLYANHHTICKFQSREDSNFVKVRDTITYLANRAKTGNDSAICHAEEQEQIEGILGIHDAIENDLTSTLSRAMEGTCQWFLKKPEYLMWQGVATRQLNAPIFWLFGLPATGKTTLTSVVVNHLKSRSRNCQYHFFSTGHQMKRTAAYCLRSIATQLARSSPTFREAMFAFHTNTKMKFASQDQKFDTIWEKIFEGIIFKMVFREPLYWVIDAVDEAEGQSTLISHLMKIQSVTPIKIFLSSRPTKAVRTLGAQTMSVTTFFLSDRDTEMDIRTYVSSTICSILPATEQVQTEITEQVLKKASGSFLWVRLALNSLKESWYTKEDIRKALSVLPPDMISMYRKMLDDITTQTSKRTQTLIKRILTWITCSWRPLRVDELKTALEPEFVDFVNFEDTVIQVCGNFVSVDAGHFSLIHATARSFLLDDGEDRSGYISVKEAHAYVAARCLAYLSDDGWRRTFRSFFAGDHEHTSLLRRPNRLIMAEKGHPLLGYSVCYWAYHVSNSPSSSGTVAEALKTFFSGYCLSWIEATALSANLRYMIKSAKYLKIYAKRKRSAEAQPESSPVLGSLMAVQEDDPRWLQNWATDLIRIVGKFGPILIAKPSSIYREIPPFCPRNSMIWQTYGEAGPAQLSVTGLPAISWDDRLGSVSIGDDKMISKILATNAYFVTLASSIGSITIWYAGTCERVRDIEISEYVPAVALNRTGTLLAAASLTNYMVWELSSGRVICRIPRISETRTMAIAITDDGAHITVCHDDCSVFKYNVHTSREVARHYFETPQMDWQGCPKVMSISPDNTSVAIIWRGKPPIIWHFEASLYQPVKVRRIRQTSDSLCAPEACVWQPDGGSLFVLCQDMNLIEWQLFDDRQIEYPHLNAREMEISRDGNLMLTSDNMGSISVWALPKMSLVYQLKSENDFIRDITFSPDNQRIYDARGSICNIWEPDVLVRPEEQDHEDQSTKDETASGSLLSSEPTMAHADTTHTIISAIAVSSTDEYYCVGRDDGLVVIHEAIGGTALRKVYTHSSSSSVLQLSWSRSGRYIVSSDDSARVIAKRLQVKAKDSWGVFPALDVRAPEPVQQFIFSSDERFLLVSTSSTDHVYDLKSKQEVCSRSWDTNKTRVWIQSPPGVDLLMSVGPHDVQVCDWNTLETRTSARLSAETIESEQGLAVVWAACTDAKGHILFGTLPATNIRGNISCLSHSGLHLEQFDLAQLLTQSQGTLPLECTPTIANRVKRLIGVFEGRIVYLDHDHRLCTWDLSLDEHGLTRHYALPRDWLGINSLELAVINAHGTLFCPRNGIVAIVRNGIRLG
jgi:WD40 repeat protein/pimeloyl-ACP methyl ester carboxylesterase